MTKLGKRLLNTPHWLETYQRQALGSIDQYAREARLDEPDYPVDKLRSDVEKMFCLEPLVLGTLKSVAVFVSPFLVATSEGKRKAYVGEARVGYKGTPRLWQARSNLKSRFPYRGRVAVISAGWRKTVPSLDLTDFEAEVRQVVRDTREALAEFAPSVKNHDAQIREKIDVVMRKIDV